ncbi:MAG TPA: kinase [Clostridiales bacterium UBA8960]|nr:kinase [Clostridiales bacterium UBA8960]
MTGREHQILEHLRKNPMISQNELADTLGIARSSVGVHIANLMKKGYILGKGYIVREDEYICVIGGSNIDIQGRPLNQLIYKDSNVGEVNISLGGVGRNIAENLVRMGMNTRLITVIGDDVYGQKILDEARLLGLNMQDSLILEGAATSTYLSILDHTHDMVLAISHMDIYERITIDFIKAKSHIIEHASLCVIDTNLPKEVIEYIVTTFKDTKFFLDTVSTTKAQKVKDLIGYFHTIKPNRIEAEILTGIPISSIDDAKRAADVFHYKGVSQVFISLGEEGVFVSDGRESFVLKAPKIEIVNATGAGDAFIAALGFGCVMQMNTRASAHLAIAASAIAISHENTINPMMSKASLFEKAKEIESC